MLLLQWVYDAARYEEEVDVLLAGPLNGMEHSRSTFSGVPQLFVILDEPSPAIRAQVADVVSGAHVGYCMTRVLTNRDPNGDGTASSAVARRESPHASVGVAE